MLVDVAGENVRLKLLRSVYLLNQPPLLVAVEEYRAVAQHVLVRLAPCCIDYEILPKKHVRRQYFLAGNHADRQLVSHEAVRHLFYLRNRDL